MIEAAATVAFGPVFGAVTPPSIKFLLCRNMLAHEIYPSAGPLHACKCGDFHRGVADYFEQIFVRPYVMLERRYIEIADNDTFMVLGY